VSIIADKQGISMDKNAQGRGLFNKIREMANVPGAVAEGFFKPELDRIMNDLRKADDNIRSILSGQKIGKADLEVVPGKSAKDLLKSARSNFNRREYMAGVADLGQFHKRMFDVTQYINKLDLSINQIHHRFLFQNLNEKQKENIQGLREHMSKASETNEEYFIKEAGIMDFFYNIGTRRGLSLGAWEKRYPKVVKDLREGGKRLLDHADNIWQNTLSLLKVMATARAIRKVDDYMEAAKRINNEYAKFDGGDRGFRAYYNNVVNPYLIKQDQMEKEQAGAGATPATEAPVPGAKEMGKQEVAAPPSTPVPAPSEFQGPETERAPSPMKPTVVLPAGGPPGAGPLGTPPGIPQSGAASPEFEGPPTERKPMTFASHSRFLESLEAMSGEDPRILASYIAKYASSIQTANAELAIKLFEMARKIRE
jgi:hypothetical protein